MKEVSELHSVLLTELAVIDRTVAKLTAKREAAVRLIEIETGGVATFEELTEGAGAEEEPAPPRQKRKRRTEAEISADKAAALVAEASEIEELLANRVRNPDAIDGEEAAQ